MGNHHKHHEASYARGEESHSHPHLHAVMEHLQHDLAEIDPFAPRWKKVIGDLWSNKARTMLVVMSIFIGVFAVGMIIGSQTVLARELQQEYLNAKPAHVKVTTGGVGGYTTDMSITSVGEKQSGFNDDLVRVIEDMEAVEVAEGRRTFSARVRVGDEWKTLQLIAIDDYDDIRVNTVNHERGAWPPPDKGMLGERSGMPTLQADVGEEVLIERTDGKQKRLEVAGVVHDVTQWPTPFLGTYYGYVTFETLEWLGEPHEFNEMLVRVAHKSDDQEHDQEHNQAVAQQVYDKIQDAGLNPAFPQVPVPNEHPLHFLITAITSLMGVLAIFAIFLSGFLVTNTIAALLAQQIKQIGIMKAVGARVTQIMGVYIVLVICFGLIALIPAVPLAQLAVTLFARFMGNFLNFDVDNTSMPYMVIGVQAVVSIVVPVVASLLPVRSGTKVSVQEAITNEGRSAYYGTSLFDRLLRRIHGLPRPLLLSLRNTFRRKGRVALTLFTLMLGGSFFISVFSIKDSLWATIDEVVDSLYNYDVEIFLDRTYRINHLVREVEQVPGVVGVEALVMTNVRRVYADDSESQKINLFAVPPETKTMNPIIMEGRWLDPDDNNALVISPGVLKDDPDMTVGSEITLKIKDRETVWTVVGVMKAMGDYRWGYANINRYTRVAREVGQASYIRIITEGHSPEYQSEMAKRVEEHLKRRGIGVSSTKTMAELSESDKQVIRVMTASLLFMATLIAGVGGLGLAGTMSLNVIERTREIGVMRTIGATDYIILQIFMVEGILIGMLSWVLGAPVSVLIGKAMSYGMGVILFSASLTYRFSLTGIVLWFLICMGISAISSFLPAWNASRITIREVLTYE